MGLRALNNIEIHQQHRNKATLLSGDSSPKGALPCLISCHRALLPEKKNASLICREAPSSQRDLQELRRIAGYANNLNLILEVLLGDNAVAVQAFETHKTPNVCSLELELFRSIRFPIVGAT